MNNVYLNTQTLACGALFVALLTAAAPATAAPRGDLSEASALSVMGGASLAYGSFTAIEGSAELLVESVEWLGERARCTLRGSERVGRVVLIIPAKAAGAVSLAAGHTVLIVFEGGGWLVTQAGRVLAFIPQKAGAALLFSEPVSR